MIKKNKKLISLLMTLCLVVTLVSVITLPAQAAVITGYTNKYTYVRMAPYWTAAVVDNMAGGVRIDIQERDYEYLYVQYDKDGITKRGYIPRADTDATGYSWCNHTYFVPGTCSDTKTVYYSPSGATPCGTIYSGENPLLILRESGNYYFVQYTTNPTDTGTTNPKFKRGWVTKTSMAISYTINAPVPNPNVSAQYILIRTGGTGAQSKYLTAVADSSQTSGYRVTFKEAQNNTSQHWILHRFVTRECVYYKIQSAFCNLYLEVDGKIPVIGTKLNLATHADPQKAQEFSFKPLYSYQDSSFTSTQYDYGVRMYTRCSGDYLTIQHSGTNTNIVQYRPTTNNSNQFMYLDPIDNYFDNEYIPARRALAFYIDPSVLKNNITSDLIIQSSIYMWNSIANISLSQGSTSSGSDIRVKGDDTGDAYGLTIPEITSDGQELTNENQYDNGWYKCNIYINTTSANGTAYMGNKSDDDIIKCIGHEFGHALKLDHPHELYLNGNRYSARQVISIMNQGLPSETSDTSHLITDWASAYDARSLKIKWGI